MLEFLELSEMAAASGLAPSEVRELCELGYVSSYPGENGETMIPDREREKLVRIKNLPHPLDHLKEAVSVFGTGFMYDYHPELLDYLLFHDTIDLLCWMIKLRYSTREVVKSKQYRIDTLFDSFLGMVSPDLGKLGRLRGKVYSEERIAFHLNKGWYNELVRAYPLSLEMLHIGTNISPSYATGKSVAWNITQSYYSVYEFVNSIVFSNTADLRTQEHRKSTRHFNKCLLGKMSRSLIPYPFNVTNPLIADIEILRGARQPFWEFDYASYPRYRRYYPQKKLKSIFDLEQDYVRLLAKDGNVLDFLYRFRVWANYLGINTIIALQNGFYLSYLYKNLGILCFFYGCLAELMAIAVLGEEQTIGLLENMAKNYIFEQPNFKENWFLIPSFIRFRMYRKHGLVRSEIGFLTPPSADPIMI